MKGRRISASFVSELTERFKRLYEGPPDWAWRFSPSIPFVGARYKPGRALMVYASAENFTWLARHRVPDRYTSVTSWDRYRARYEEAGRLSGEFFPDIGIQPATDGGLFAAALFVSQRLDLPLADTPRGLLERIAITNWAKFTIFASHRNRDYIHNLDKLTPSLPFVVTELAVLRPAVVLIPRAVWASPILAAAMRGASPETVFLPVPQFNATVVNCALRENHAEARRLRRKYAQQSIGTWMGRLVGIREEHAWRYPVAIEAVLQSYMTTGQRPVTIPAR